MNDDPRSILHDVFYSDVAGIMCSYLYVRCDLCDAEILQENSVDGTTRNYYCSVCVQKPRIKKCNACNRFYDYLSCPFPCPVCIGGCVIYCNICYTSIGDVMYGEVYDNPHINYYWTIFDTIYHQHQ